MLPAVRTYISLPAGVAAMSVGRFLVYSFLGSLLWTAALVWAGTALGLGWRSLAALARRFDLVLALALVVATLVWLRALRRGTVRPKGGR